MYIDEVWTEIESVNTGCTYEEYYSKTNRYMCLYVQEQ